MEKKTKLRLILNKINSNEPFIFKDYKDYLQDDDILTVGWVDGEYSDNESFDGRYQVKVERWTLETDEEFSKRVEHNKWMTTHNKNLRRETYLRLRKEFKGEDLPTFQDGLLKLKNKL